MKFFLILTICLLLADLPASAQNTSLKELMRDARNEQAVSDKTASLDKAKADLKEDVKSAILAARYKSLSKFRPYLDEFKQDSTFSDCDNIEIYKDSFSWYFPKLKTRFTPTVQSCTKRKFTDNPCLNDAEQREQERLTKQQEVRANELCEPLENKVAAMSDAYEELYDEYVQQLTSTRFTDSRHALQQLEQKLKDIDGSASLAGIYSQASTLDALSAETEQAWANLKGKAQNRIQQEEQQRVEAELKMQAAREMERQQREAEEKRRSDIQESLHASYCYEQIAKGGCPCGCRKKYCSSKGSSCQM